MKTMKAFWRYDWVLNRTRVITMLVFAALWPWVMAISQKGMQAGAEWALYTTVFSSVCILAVPVILLGYASDLGRTAAPFDFRHFSRTLPIDQGRWALAKVVSVLGWGVVVPGLLLMAMTAAAVWILRDTEISGMSANLGLMLSGLLFVGIASAGTLWSMLSAALMPRGQSSGGGGAFLGAVLFFCGELAVLIIRNVTFSIRGLGQAMSRVRGPWESASEIGLCLLLTAALALVFVRYHKNRRTLEACLLALTILTVIDAARAWLWR